MAALAIDVTQRVQQHVADRAKQAEDNRKRFPTAAYAIDQLRKAGIKGFTLQHAAENGNEFGVDPEKEPGCVTLPYYKPFIFDKPQS